jgi:predicted histidine transporter YuiF (NhaC family)
MRPLAIMLWAVFLVTVGVLSTCATKPVLAGPEYWSVGLSTNQAYGFWCDGTLNAVSGSTGVLGESATGFTLSSKVTLGCTSNRDAGMYKDVRNTVPTWHLYNGDKIDIFSPAGWCVYNKVHSQDIDNAVAWDC